MSTILGCGLYNLAVLVLVGTYAIVVLRTPIYHPFSVYLIYHFLGFVVRPLSIYQQDGSFLWMRIGIIPTDGDIFRTTIVSTTALLAFTAGMVVVSGNKPLPRIAPVSLQVNHIPRFVVAILVATAAGYYATYRSVAGAGLDQVLAYNTEMDADGAQRLVGISGYVTALAEVLPILCIFLFLIPKLRMFAILFIAIFAGFRLFAGAHRLSFVVVLAGLFFLYHVNKGYRYPRLLPLVGILCFAVVFDVIGNDRYAFRGLVYGTTTVSDVLESYTESRGANVGTSDIVEFDVATAAMAVITSHNDYSYGSQYLRILVWPIPRQLWPDKPVITNIVNLNRYGDFRFLTHSLYGDVYMNFGYGLVPIQLFLLGAFYGWIYLMVLRTESAIGYMFYWVVLMYTKTVLRDGGVGFLYFWIFSMLPVMIIVACGKIRLVRHPLPERPERPSVALPGHIASAERA